ncbi:hypothetical protein RRG08_034989 [Elysia crispata]|uniref:Uncharacterized protein n=1 Tax=Elysia crispata TaxID=231223 RepID=A0AAE0Y227_9GAST|nr:hypothetical protein RRG08_034989 [Elysia crispata]
MVTLYYFERGHHGTIKARFTRCSCLSEEMRDSLMGDKKVESCNRGGGQSVGASSGPHKTVLKGDDPRRINPEEGSTIRGRVVVATLPCLGLNRPVVSFSPISAGQASDTQFGPLWAHLDRKRNEGSRCERPAMWPRERKISKRTTGNHYSWGGLAKPSPGSAPTI